MIVEKLFNLIGPNNHYCLIFVKRKLIDILKKNRRMRYNPEKKILITRPKYHR